MASYNPSSSSSSITSSSAGAPASGSVIKREKRTVASYLKEESAKARNLKPLNDYLDSVLDPKKPIDDFENLDTCKWIIAGGMTFDEFGKKGNPESRSGSR